ncbi:MAG: chorismate mutase [Amaricoccus sp.]|uniref:chorismate mutase n=1 Tax=Amaricoccus sp. TaxID=1872485 RepID=UPI0039E60DD7
MTTPHPAMAPVRAEIDRLDRALVALLIERAACIDRAIEVKAAEGLPPRIPARVDEVVENACAAAADGGLDVAFVEALWRQIVEWSIAREERVLGSGGAE